MEMLTFMYHNPLFDRALMRFHLILGSKRQETEGKTNKQSKGLFLPKFTIS